MELCGMSVTILSPCSLRLTCAIYYIHIENREMMWLQLSDTIAFEILQRLFSDSKDCPLCGVNINSQKAILTIDLKKRCYTADRLDIAERFRRHE